MNNFTLQIVQNGYKKNERKQNDRWTKLECYKVIPWQTIEMSTFIEKYNLYGHVTVFYTTMSNPMIGKLYWIFKHPIVNSLARVKRSQLYMYMYVTWLDQLQEKIRIITMFSVLLGQ